MVNEINFPRIHIILDHLLGRRFIKYLAHWALKIREIFDHHRRFFEPRDFACASNCGVSFSAARSEEPAGLGFTPCGAATAVAPSAIITPINNPACIDLSRTTPPLK